jgi:hypothetical protein
MDEIYRGFRQILQEYAESERLYLTRDERRRQFEVLSNAAKATKALDQSGIPPVLRDTVAPERTIQLKEILDRIEVPPFESIQIRKGWCTFHPSVGGCRERRSISP